MKQNRIPPDMDLDDLNFPDTLRLTVESPEAARDRAEAVADAAEDGEQAAATRSFADVTEFRDVLTPRRVEVIQTLIDHEVESIQELADRLDRNYPDVHADVSRLADYGIVYYRERGRAKAPVVPYDRVEIEGTVAEARPA
jgi:predicted transcriptional regulator